MNNKTVRAVLGVLSALIIFAVAFTAGFFTRKCTQNGAGSSLEWALDIIEKNYYFGGAPDNVEKISIGAVAQNCLDRYSQYYTAEEYAAEIASNAGSKSGIGISYSFVEGRGIYIASVMGNSPAYKAGLRRGEWLKSGVRGDGQTEFNSAKDFENFIDADTGEGMVFVSASGKSYPAMSKAHYTASYAYLATGKTAWTFGDSADGGLALYETPSEKIEYLPEGGAYLYLSQFYGSAPSEVFTLIEKFNAEGCTSLIIDLRSNGGGYVDVMQKIAGAFADGEEKPAMIARDKYGKEEVYTCLKVTEQSRRIGKDKKVYVLANSGTASASEALIGALLCYGALDYKNIYLSDYSDDYLQWLKTSGQEIKTARTYGKGIMQSTFVNRRTGEALKLTTAEIFWPDGNTGIHDKGITLAKGCNAIRAEWQHTIPDDELKLAVEAIYG